MSIKTNKRRNLFNISSRLRCGFFIFNKKNVNSLPIYSLKSFVWHKNPNWNKILFGIYSRSPCELLKPKNQKINSKQTDSIK